MVALEATEVALQVVVGGLDRGDALCKGAIYGPLVCHVNLHLYE